MRKGCNKNMDSLDKLKDELGEFEEDIIRFKEEIESAKNEIVEMKMSLDYAEQKRKELIEIIKKLEGKGENAGPFVGMFGNVIVAPGTKSADQLINDFDGIEQILVVSSFSSFMPDPNGQVKLECRQGYLWNGKEKIPVTNFIFGSYYWDMFRNAHLSREEMDSGYYRGPRMIRFEGPFQVRKN